MDKSPFFSIFIRFYFIHFSRLNSISLILFWENTGSASENYQVFEISNHYCYFSVQPYFISYLTLPYHTSYLTFHSLPYILPYILPYLILPYLMSHLTLLYFTLTLPSGPCILENCSCTDSSLTCIIVVYLHYLRVTIISSWFISSVWVKDVIIWPIYLLVSRSRSNCIRAIRSHTQCIFPRIERLT